MNEQLGISGKWTNKVTGQTINVRDSIIDGDRMIIISDQGQIDMTEFSQYYIQTSDEIYDEGGRVIDKQPVSFSEIKQPNQNDMYTHNFDLNKPISDDLGNITVSTETHQIVSGGSSKTANYGNFELIDKLFKRKNYNPVIKIDIQSSDFPLNELKMLMDIYDVDSSDIANYLLKEYINQDTICDSVLNYVEKKLIKFSE
jgi:hypothetical protein